MEENAETVATGTPLRKGHTPGPDSVVYAQKKRIQRRRERNKQAKVSRRAQRPLKRKSR